MTSSLRTATFCDPAIVEIIPKFIDVRILKSPVFVNEFETSLHYTAFPLFQGLRCRYTDVSLWTSHTSSIPVGSMSVYTFRGDQGEIRYRYSFSAKGRKSLIADPPKSQSLKDRSSAARNFRGLISTWITPQIYIKPTASIASPIHRSRI